MFRLLLIAICLIGITAAHSNFMKILKQARAEAKKRWDSSASPYDSYMDAWDSSTPSYNSWNYMNAWDSSSPSPYDTGYMNSDSSTPSYYDGYNWETGSPSPYDTYNWDAGSPSPYGGYSWDAGSPSPFDSATSGWFYKKNYGDSSASPYYGYNWNAGSPSPYEGSPSPFEGYNWDAASASPYEGSQSPLNWNLQYGNWHKRDKDAKAITVSKERSKKLNKLKEALAKQTEMRESHAERKSISSKRLRKLKRKLNENRHS